MKLLALFLLSCSAAFGQIPFERIVNADKEPGNWLTYSRDLEGQRFSPLAEINTENVSHLKVKWAFQFPDAGNEVSPIVIDGILYITGPNAAAALDGRSGRPLWIWRRPLPSDYHSIGFGHVNRGPAVLDDKLFVATLDGYLVALDLKSGAERWSSQVLDYKGGYSMTMAPLAIDGKIVVGVSGGEAGIRGFIDAYEAKSGKQVWRFWTIPAPGEPGHETWSGDAWKTGGGATWVTGSYDPALKLVYWGVGNPGPDWNGDVRPGDNLYTCSMVALDADTGKLRWYFQFSPHDTHDWDATHVPMLFDVQQGGAKRKLLAVANRNAFYYVLDRSTGEFVAGQPYAKQTWATGLDPQGRPIPARDAEPSKEGTLVWPNLNGELPPDDAWGAIKALKAESGDLRWQFKLRSPPWAGVLSTAGGLVFSGSNEGNFYALDARTGRPLWDFQTGGPIGANPVSFNIEGHQWIAIAADRVLYAFGL